MDANYTSSEQFTAQYPKQLSEDCVTYNIFIIDPLIGTEDELAARLKTVLDESFTISEKLLKDYIWQRESFRLELSNNTGRTFLQGITHFGDSIEDEWLIVYILKELSRKFPNIWIQVVDTSGEFLLIEAANVLPRWLNPEIADNRVWINSNKLFIIPLIAAPFKSSDNRTAPISRSLEQEEALKIIRFSQNILVNSPSIEEEAFYRLRNYPDQVSKYLHYSLIRIPRKLAAILHRLPASISPAIEAFYLRDPISLKALQVDSSELVFPPKDLVKISARFTKLLFAQIKSQEFLAPYSWKDILKDAKFHDGKSYEQLKLGMKLTSGFEMLIKDPQFASNPIIQDLKILIEVITKDNQSNLPSDHEISQWKDVLKDDDEKWLDIDIRDFDRELGGNSNSKDRNPLNNSSQERDSRFGDAKAQADLKKIVERFESFINDDRAGVDGADFDDEDEGEKLSGEYSDDSDSDVSLDLNEREFQKILRDIMGIPLDKDGNGDFVKSEEFSKAANTSHEDSAVDEAHEIKIVMQRVEDELNEAGVLKTDSVSEFLAMSKNEIKLQATVKENYISDDSDDDEVNIDYNLAKNLLESFKSQGGLAGPAGNLLGMMGVQLPRDESEI